MKKIIFLLLITLSFNTFAQDQILDIPIKTLKGETTRLADITADNDLVLVSLWATWCVPCKKELDAINDVYIDWQEETNVKLVAVSVDDARTVNRVKPMVNGKAWDFTILLDTNGDLKRALNTVTVPFTFIIKKGEIVFKHSGYTPGAENALYDELKKHM